jgi:hypothetical protein
VVPPFFREYRPVYLHNTYSGLITQLTAESPLRGRIHLERFNDHLRKGQQVFMLKPQSYIPYAQVIKITAPAFRNIADV